MTSTATAVRPAGATRVERTRRALRHSQLFGDLGEATLSRVAAACDWRTLAPGATLFAENDAADALYIVERGLVRVWTCEADGEELTLALIEPGEALGEMAVLDGKPRCAHATAVTAVDLLRLGRGELLALMAGDTAVALRLFELLSERLRRANQERRAAAFRHLGCRLAAKLVELVIAVGELEGDRARIVGVSQADLAQMLGVTREAVNKQLRRLAAAGLCRQERGAIAVLSLSGLRRRAEGAARA